MKTELEIQSMNSGKDEELPTLFLGRSSLMIEKGSIQRLDQNSPSKLMAGLE